MVLRGPDQFEAMLFQQPFVLLDGIAQRTTRSQLRCAPRPFATRCKFPRPNLLPFARGSGRVCSRLDKSSPHLSQSCPRHVAVGGHLAASGRTSAEPRPSFAYGFLARVLLTSPPRSSARQL